MPIRLRSAGSIWLFALAAVALAACGGPASAPTPVRAPEPIVRPIVLLLHGRGLLGRDTVALRRAWEASLRSGAAGLTGSPILGDSDVRVVWYADVLDPQSNTACAFSADDPRADRVMGGDSALQTLASGAANVLGALGSLFGGSEADTQLRAFAGDLQYFGDPAKRCAADRRLTTALAEATREGRPIVLVAHSFGSLVAYDVLTARRPDTSSTPAIERLVTVGAMIGAPMLRRMVFGTGDTLSMPTGVKSWVNVRNPADPLAVPLSEIPRSARDGAFSRFVDTTTSAADNDPDTHEMVGYLRDTVTAKAVVSAWCAAFTPARARPSACAKAMESPSA